MPGQVRLHALQHVQLLKQQRVVREGGVEPTAGGGGWLEQRVHRRAHVPHEEEVDLPLRPRAARIPAARTARTGQPERG